MQPRPSGCCGPGCRCSPAGSSSTRPRAICADHRLAAEEVLELLAALADKSILIAEHGEGGVRYRLPETLREFGQERLQRVRGVHRAAAAAPGLA